MDVIDELITHCEAWEPWARVMGNVCAGDAAQALRNLRAELANKDQILGDTLAVLCGDGGHYRAEHGDIKAKEHGLKRYHDLLVSEDGLRAELAAQSKLDCRTCFWYGNISEVCNRAGGAGRCGGIRHVSTLPIRLYEIDAALAADGDKP